MQGDHQFYTSHRRDWKQHSLKDYLPALNISLIAVDEKPLHFRSGVMISVPYLRIAKLRDELPGIPVLALTASATPEVQQDIVLQLKFTNAAVFRQSFERGAIFRIAYFLPIARSTRRRRY